MSKTCIKCGAELEENAIFCDECGARQTAATDGAADASDISSNKEKSEEYENKEKSQALGTISFVMGIFSIVTLGAFYLPVILGLICGILGRQDKTKNHGLATAGFVLSLIAAAMIVFG